MMIDWTAVKINGKIAEHSTIEKATFNLLGRDLPCTIVEYSTNDRVWVQIDGSDAQHLIDKSELTYVEGN